MQQNIIDAQFVSRSGRQGVRKLNREAGPLHIKSKNTMSTMKSKAFPVSRRTSNAVTNMSPKAVANPTSGRPGAGSSIGKKKFTPTRVVQVKPAQRSMTGANPIKKTVSTQPKSMSAVRTSLRKTMGYK